MVEFFTTFALLTAGVALISGIINLVIGFHKDGERADLVFGILALIAFIFLVLPPKGFVLADKAPYSTAIIVKRIFVWAYYMLMPWFFELYSGYKKRIYIYASNGLFFISYFLMVFTKNDTSKPIWILLSLIPFGLNLVYGLIASSKQIKQNHKEGYWLRAAMIVYGILFVPLVVNQIGNNYFGSLLGVKIFFLFHLNLFAFITIMSIRLRTSLLERFKLERILRWRDKRWDSLIENMQLLVIELDKFGNIQFLNPYTIRRLGYQTEDELKGRNWFDLVAPIGEAAALKLIYSESIKNEKILTEFTTKIKAKGGNKLAIKWANVFIHDKNDQVKGITSIGMDITEQKVAFEQVQQLKSELEKENLYLKGGEFPPNEDANIIGHSSTLLYAMQKAKQVATTNAGVLLLGETGTGKELLANFIHSYSYRSSKPFIKVNCAALPADLIESELFGHEKGAFTGAYQQRKGKFELANGGTIFLDEIAELPITLQSKLLHVLQNGEFDRIGGHRSIKVDVRIITATNKNLMNEVKLGNFREDLYYRLDVFPITIPSLRDRKEDIEPLVIHFVKKVAFEQKKSIYNISKGDLARLNEYNWPGNIRELINLIERSVISSDGPTLKLDWNTTFTDPVKEEPSIVSIEEVERHHILKVLNNCNWKINGEEGAASKLGLHPSTLRSRLKKLQINRGKH